MATEIDKAKGELHARIEALDAYNEQAWNSTVEEIQEEAAATRCEAVTHRTITSMSGLAGNRTETARKA